MNVPLHLLYTYLSSQDVKIGTRVEVEFGTKKVIGFVWEILEYNEVNLAKFSFKLKDILYFHSEIISIEIIKLINFLSSYYHYPIGQTIFSVVPNLWKKNRHIELKKNLVKQKLFHHNYPIIKLNNEQQLIVDAITVNINNYSSNLIYGITGSGKTEVYLEVVQKVINKKKQVLILVPEINLTPQFLDKIEYRFQNHIIRVFNSNITEKQKLLTYKDTSEGLVDIVIGTRSAVFMDFKQLGLIVIDEEHDLSFKQSEHLRYHARSVAVWRAEFNRIPIILGSATPSLESLYNYKLKKYNLFKLNNRAVENARLPEIKLIDLNVTSIKNGLSSIAIEEIQKRIELKEISLVFINRRGYSPIISCYYCSWVESCHNCSSNLVLHLKTKQLKCHHCGYTTKIKTNCPKCNSQHINQIGFGTQRIEESLNNIFPNTRIFRVDQDTIKSKKSFSELREKINSNQIDIIVGTQLLSKGHDFHNITLVVGLEIDGALYSNDFRASEYLYSQLIQVSGRSGRGEKQGLVLLQTYSKNHKLFQSLIKNDFLGFVNYNMNIRKLFNLPPYYFFATIKSSSKNKKNNLIFLNQIIQYFNFLELNNIFISDITNCILEKLRGEERMQVIIKSPVRKTLQSFLTKLVMAVNKEIKLVGGVSWVIDVDPFDF